MKQKIEEVLSATWAPAITMMVLFVACFGWNTARVDKQISRIDQQIAQQGARIDQQGARTDKLYEMFVDLLKERKNER